jgi:hypothetical protein
MILIAISAYRVIFPGSARICSSERSKLTGASVDFAGAPGSFCGTTHLGVGANFSASADKAGVGGSNIALAARILESTRTEAPLLPSDILRRHFR